MADSRLRRWTYGVLTFAIAGALAELLSLGLHPLVFARPFSVQAFDDDRRVARRADPRSDVPSEQPEAFLREDALSPYLGFTGSPQVDAGFSNLGFWGSLGWPPPTRNPNTVLVGIAGGSFAAELYSSGAERLRAGLSKIPQLGAKSIVLVNMAHGGWKQPQQLLALSWMLALGGELDILINVDGFNEVALDGAENAVRGVFPAYPRGWALRVDDFIDGDQTILLASVAQRSERRATMASSFDYGILRWSPTAQLVWGLLDRRLNNDLVAAQLSLARSRSRQDRFRQVGPSVHADPDERLRILVEVWRNASIALARQSVANGIRYFQFLQPNQYDEKAKPMEAEELRVAFREDCPPSAPMRQIAGIE